MGTTRRSMALHPTWIVSICHLDEPQDSPFHHIFLSIISKHLMEIQKKGQMSELTKNLKLETIIPYSDN
jgi:hypothetical protein